MKRFLIIFIAGILALGMIVGKCNGSDNETTARDPMVGRYSHIALEGPEEEPIPQDTFIVCTLDSTALELAQFTKKQSEQILVRLGYTTSYNSITKCPNWVAWHLTEDHTDGPWTRKGIPYMVDEEVEGPRQELTDWQGHDLPIDHGHMCPAGDNKWSKQAMEASFLLTNFCPQNAILNNGDWKHLEERCRGWARHYGEVYIACGPIFNGSSYKTIGDNQVGVPDAFFKVVLRMGKRPAALGFIYPNRGGHQDMSQYVMTVDEVEAKTGIDFFYNLPDDVEDVVEAQSDIKKW